MPYNFTDPGWDKVRDYDTSDFKEQPVTVVPGAWDKEISEVVAYLVTMGDRKVKLEVNQLFGIKDARVYIERELEVARANNGNPTYRPYLNRAISVMNQVKLMNP